MIITLLSWQPMVANYEEIWCTHCNSVSQDKAVEQTVEFSVI